jgi:hypothetical protein
MIRFLRLPTPPSRLPVMRRMLLVLTVAGLAGAGCREETPAQRCDRLRTAARKAIVEYADPRWTEGDRLSASNSAVMERWNLANEANRQMTSAKYDIRCGYLRFVNLAPQPTRSAMERLIDRFQVAVDAGRSVTGALAAVGTPLDPTSFTAATRATDALADSLVSWDAKIPLDQLRPGKPWSAEQEAYLAAVEDAWCALERTVAPLIESRKVALDHEIETERSAYEAAAAALDAYRNVTYSAVKLREDLLAAEPTSLTVPPSLQNDPAFSPSEDALSRFNGCRE